MGVKVVNTFISGDRTLSVDQNWQRAQKVFPDIVAHASGHGVTLYTSELAELRLACDRVVVIFGGRVVGVIDAAMADEPTLLWMAHGQTEAAQVSAACSPPTAGCWGWPDCWCCC